jgi:hypothetical protein
VEIMSMDRLRFTLAGGMLAMMLGTIVTASGCRSTGNEVPPGPKYSTTGDPASSVKFNSDPHPVNGVGGSYYGNSPVPGQSGMPSGGGMAGSVMGATPDGLPTGIGPGSSSPYGTPTGSAPNMGQPTANAYGPPSTAGFNR